MNATEEAAAIFNWYFAQFAKAAGLRWSERNADDIERAAELLGQVEDEPAGDEIPPYERPIVNDRQTLVLERDEAPPARERIPIDPEWEQFQRWRAMRAEEERYSQVRRMVNR